MLIDADLREIRASDRSAARLEKFLGDPDRETAVSAFAHSVAQDDRDEMPWRAMDALRSWEFPAFLVPEAFGGRLRSFAELFAMCRSVARRDLRLAVSFGTTLLGANPVWLWGTDQQRQWLASRLLAGDLGSFAMSEREHGSDLAGCQVSARREGDRYVLDGEKWPVGNATRGTFCTVYARTGPRQFSLLLVDKRRLPAQRHHNSPGVPTVGLRGHDLSGITFTDCPVPADSLLGSPGAGIPQTMKTLQITRTLIAALSLGSLDTGLRLAYAHARSRRLYGAPITALPAIRDILVRAYLDLIIGECVSVPAVRAITESPERLSLWSAIVKYFVPVTVERALADLNTVLSARGYLRDSLPARTFQKLHRDQAIASIFEGTTHVNLSSIAADLLFAANRSGGDPTLLPALFDRQVELTPWVPDARRLSLSNGGQDEIGGAWPQLSDRFSSWPSVRRLDAARRDLTVRLAEMDRRAPGSALGHTSARVHCVLHAAACVLLTGAHNSGDVFADESWMMAALDRLTQHLDPTWQLSPGPAAAVEAMVTAQVETPELFSLTPIPLPAGE
ncbi:alkylation response protein AidB-like acyl-CoA dehydrogenase [Micromonospora echinospora]|uniref:Alkylation response protein AidB-like acyl-CoA dehydrogenase n=1 Tax=Micromonospora echinospora TaxID=1877 RepID=A0ABR6MF20_MICEC|nr:acyl-CoA dehydrogenase family protein [Micromonospora echinospora]MBB5113240.1 alkylation response protein AidB-like acyl-CoA dehydrogenase [Micromonospora echinospora]